MSLVYVNIKSAISWPFIVIQEMQHNLKLFLHQKNLHFWPSLSIFSQTLVIKVGPWVDIIFLLALPKFLSPMDPIESPYIGRNDPILYIIFAALV